jgi:hypothetical protein
VCNASVANIVVGVLSTPTTGETRSKSMRIIISKIVKKQKQKHAPGAQTTKPCFVVWAPFVLVSSPFSPSDSLSYCRGSCPLAQINELWAAAVCSLEINMLT